MGLLPLVLAPVPEEHLRRGFELLRELSGALSAESDARRLAATWGEQHVPDRARRDLVSLAALLASAERTSAATAQRRLALSTREGSHLRSILRALQCGPWHSSQPVTPLVAHRYYREYGAGGADAAALMLAARSASCTGKETARGLLVTWLDSQAEIVAPAPLLSGHDLIDGLRINPGPQVGALLRALKEAQVQGTVGDHAQAWAWARAQLAVESLEGKQV